ncbi:MAG: hypothetical protein K9H25_05850 [Rhodospirillum sp.]|nr:hypothetical protein [Rhodospirillum sp.]MCF8490231.1 hypothetical protein [Rhodospirillum sp.]MCF8500992.1 hypothetical protein [Rhodospirillum sp.]
MSGYKLNMSSYKLNMSSYKLLTAAILSVSLLSGCVTTAAGTGTGTANTTDALDDYTTEYTVTGAVALGAVGCGLGFLIGGNVESCVAGGVAGAALGGAGGYALAENQKGMETEKLSLIQTRDTLKSEVDKAKNAREVAAGLVASHKAKIETLRKLQAANQSQNVALVQAIASAKADLKRMGAVREKLDNQIKTAEAALDADKTPSKDKKSENAKAKAELKTIKKNLIAERTKLDKDIAILEGTIGPEDATKPSA